MKRREFLRAGAAGFISGGCPSKNQTTFGSKNFQEQWILAEVLKQLVSRNTPHPAETKDLQGTFLCHKALVGGQIDAYVEYTGTAYSAVLKQAPIHDVDRVFREVAKAYAKRFDLRWLAPLGFENTYAILVRASDAKKEGLHKISDLKRVQDKFRPGFAFEFYERADGYPGLTKAYGLEFAQAPKQMKIGLMYRSLVSNEVDVIAGNSTDGQIESLNLVTLEDDRRYFPPYHAAVVLRKNLEKTRPDVVQTLESLSGKIGVDLMRKANHRVDGEKRSPREAAEALLAEVAPASG